MQPVVQLENVTKTYSNGEVEVHAVRGITLQVMPGEFVAIMGSSGSGKDGVDTSGLERNERADLRNRKLGFVFQGFNLLSRTTALENVELPMLYSAERISSAERRRRAVQALDIVGLSDRAEHLPNQLSGGQQQRVAIARALVNRPQVLLADEPTGNLDSRTSVEIMGVFQRLNEEGITIMMVTHELDIARFCRRNLIVRDGCIVRDEAVPDRLVAAVEVQRLREAETAAKLIGST
jgi:putative ABC transport system ATP-binding protein